VRESKRENQPLPLSAAPSQEWADLLEAGMLVAFKAAEDQRQLEGDYWLAKLLGPAFVVPADMLHAGTEYEEGWLICEAQWYKLEQRSERGYRCAIPRPCISALCASCPCECMCCSCV
jgi:hypothetical protein